MLENKARIHVSELAEGKQMSHLVNQPQASERSTLIRRLLSLFVSILLVNPDDWKWHLFYVIGKHPTRSMKSHICLKFLLAYMTRKSDSAILVNRCSVPRYDLGTTNPIRPCLFSPLLSNSLFFFSIAKYLTSFRYTFPKRCQKLNCGKITGWWFQIRQDKLTYTGLGPSKHR